MSSTTGREDAWRILKSVIEQLDPRRLVADSITHDEALEVRGVAKKIEYTGRLVVIAVGKAAVPMASGALDSLGDSVSAALAVTKAGIPYSVEPPARLDVFEADHPVPSQASLDAGRKVRELVDGLGEQDVLLMLISGGGSALIEDLVDGVTLQDLRSATDHMLRAGATINELNAVRRRISRIKGGRLAGLASPARIVNLIVSDVLNSPLQDIASGPTVAPPERDLTFESVMHRPELIDALPQTIRKALESQRGDDESWPDNVHGTVVLADAESAARLAIDFAVGLGYRVQSLGFDFQGEAREFGRTFATIARHAAKDNGAFPLPLALVGTGELTVTVRGGGTGGRNTEMALAAALEISGLDGLTITSFATDGDDGVSACAGGVVDGNTVQRTLDAGFEIVDRLNDNDSASVLSEIDETIDIGPTGTNVNDLYIALVHATSEK